MSEKDAATVLEEAADLLLMRGVHRGSAGEWWKDAGPLCAAGAVHTAVGAGLMEWGRDDAMEVLHRLAPRVSDHHHPVGIFKWNDSTEDDFEVIDTLRHVAKDLRNEAKS